MGARQAPSLREIIAKLREIVLRLSFVAGKELILASPILKFVSPMDDLKHPCVISKGIRAALKRAGISDHDLSIPMEVQGETPPSSAALTPWT